MKLKQLIKHINWMDVYFLSVTLFYLWWRLKVFMARDP